MKEKLAILNEISENGGLDIELFYNIGLTPHGIALQGKFESNTVKVLRSLGYAQTLSDSDFYVLSKDNIEVTLT